MKKRILVEYISIVILASFLAQISGYCFDFSYQLFPPLSPPSRFDSKDFGRSLALAALCRYIESEGDLASAPYLEDMVSRLGADKKMRITVLPDEVLPDEIIIEIPDEGMTVRYKVVDDRLCRRVIYGTSPLESKELMFLNFLRFTLPFLAQLKKRVIQATGLSKSKSR